MLDLQERDDAPEPAVLVAGDEADVRAELAEGDGMSNSKFTLEAMKHAAAVGVQGDGTVQIQAWVDAIGPVLDAHDDLLAACNDASDWLARYGADAPDAFGGEAELYQRLYQAILKGSLAN